MPDDRRNRSRLVRPSLDELEAAPGSVLLAGGTEVVPQLRDGLLEADTLVDISGARAARDRGHAIGAGTTLAELEATPRVPAALREACRLAASPQLREHGHGRRQPAPVDALLVLAARLPLPAPRRRPLPRARRRAPRARDLRQRLLRLGASVRRRPRRSSRSARPCGRPPRAPGRRALPRARRRRPPHRRRSSRARCCSSSTFRPPDASVYLKAMDRKRFGFPLVGVAAARRGGTTTVALAGVAPVPWLLDGPLDERDAAPRHRVQGRDRAGAGVARAR